MAGQPLALIAGRGALLTQQIALAANEGLQRIAPQVVMVINVFVAQGQPVNALGQQRFQGVFDIARVAVVDKTVGQGPEQAAVAFQFP